MEDAPDDVNAGRIDGEFRVKNSDGMEVREERIDLQRLSSDRVNGQGGHDHYIKSRTLQVNGKVVSQIKHGLRDAGVEG